MEGRIDRNGYLKISRRGHFYEFTRCPYNQQGQPCHVMCPMFGDVEITNVKVVPPGKTTKGKPFKPVMEKRYQLDLCRKIIIFGEFTNGCEL